MGKLSKKDTYYGCDSYDFEYFQPNPPKIRLQKLEDGYYTRCKRKGIKKLWYVDFFDSFSIVLNHGFKTEIDAY